MARRCRLGRADGGGLQRSGGGAETERFAAREAELRPETAALYEKSEMLKAKAAGTDRKATAEAVEAVHSQYQKVEALLTSPPPAE